MRWRPVLRDPDGTALRRGLRVGLLTPVVLALGEVVLDDRVAALFAALGVIVLLGFVDFDGPPLARARAYAATTAAGALLIAALTPLSPHTVAAAAGTAVAVFAIRFAGTLGGRVEAAGSALVLATVLAAVVPAPAGELDSRLLGWVGAGLLSLAATLLLWPRYEQRRFAGRVARAARAAAAAVRDAERTDAAQEELRALRGAFLLLPFSPRGFWRRDRALRRMADGLFRLRLALPAPPDSVPADRDLRAAAADALDAAAVLLERPRSGARRTRRAAAAAPPLGVPELLRLEQRRIAQLATAADFARDALAARRPGGEVLEALDAMFQLRVVAFEVQTIAANAVAEAGLELPPADRFLVPPDVPAPVGSLQLGTAVTLLRTQLGRFSARTRDAVRAAAGIGAAVLIAGLADVGHGMWVVLATLLALRSNAAGTARTAAEAIAGTVGGFVIAAALMLALGGDEALLWIALPPAAFLAGYAPEAIGFAAGQGTFALLVVVLFNLLEPAGWEVGLERVADVAIGVGIALAVSLLLWPRGARAEIGRAAGEALEWGSRYVRGALGWLLGDGGAALDDDRAETTAALRRCSEALAQHAGEPGTDLSRQAMFDLLDGPAYLRATGDMLRAVGVGQGVGVGAAPELRLAARETLAGLDRLGALLVAGDRADRSLDDPPPGGAAPAAPAGRDDDPARAEAIAALEAWGGSDDEALRARAIRLTYGRESLRLLDRLARDLYSAAAELESFSAPAAARPA